MLWTGGIGALGLLGQGVTVLFLTIFLLYEDDSFKRKLVAQMESQNSKRITVRILNDIAAQIERFIWVQALTSAAVAVATWLALWWLGIAEPMVWGVLAGVLNIVPYFGPLIVTAGLAIVAFLQFGTIEMAALIAGVALAITTIEGVFLTPHMLSRAAALNHVAIFVAIAFWSWAWGVPGMLLAAPMLMVVKAICDHVDGLKAVGMVRGCEGPVRGCEGPVRGSGARVRARVRGSGARVQSDGAGVHRVEETRQAARLVSKG
jgi:predicted PurR-regulated permease PerM